MGASVNLAYISEEELFELLSPKDAVLALRAALKAGFQPAGDLARSSEDIEGGQMLLMPSSMPAATGIKVLTMAPGNAAHGLPYIQGAYLLFDGDTLAPVAVLDGAGLTNLRTPALSFAGVYEPLLARASRGGELRVVIFGTGPQARFHQRALESVLAGEAAAQVSFVSRTDPGDLPGWLAAGSDEAREAVCGADVILCCTTSSTPVVVAEDVPEDAIVVALGSHTPGNRELPGQVLADAQVIVEELGAAQREAGDVIQAVDEGHLSWDDVILFKDVVSGAVRLDGSRRIVFKTTGMPWEDLVLAEAAYKAHRA